MANRVIKLPDPRDIDPYSALQLLSSIAEEMLQDDDDLLSDVGAEFDQQLQVLSAQTDKDLHDMKVFKTRLKS